MPQVLYPSNEELEKFLRALIPSASKIHQVRENTWLIVVPTDNGLSYITFQIDVGLIQRWTEPNIPTRLKGKSG